MIEIREKISLEQVYCYQAKCVAPYFFSVDYDTWRKSFMEDIDGEGRTLFKTLTVRAAFVDEKIVGYIQYGHTAFGFDENGEISSDVSYGVIRNLYYDEEHGQAGQLLLQAALDELKAEERIYAFFHYFGMSCYARHGKLFQQFAHIEALLRANGFQTEHENVYYSSVLDCPRGASVELRPCDRTRGNQQYIDFFLSGNHVGGCEVHFLNSHTTYLRWIYVNGDIVGQGVGTKCMAALQNWLWQQGIRRFDTDTALQNLVAQHFYEKTGFTREGVTRSFYRNEKRGA